MSLQNLKMMSVLVLIAFCSFQAEAQVQKTLIQETNKNINCEKKWKIEWGVIGSAGVSNVLKPNEPRIESMYGSETAPTSYSILYAPRPEAELGFFGEISKVNSIFSFQSRITYTMRAIPQPVFSGSSTVPAQEYKSTYLNGLTMGGTFFINPVSKFKIGLGLEATGFLITKEIADSEHGEYTESFKSVMGLRMVLGYQISPRMDMNVYGSISNSHKENSMNYEPDNVSAGIMMLYRISGKEIHVKRTFKEKKEVYKLVY